MCVGGVRSILLLPLVAICLETIDVCIWRMFVLMAVVVTVWGMWECLLCSGRFEHSVIKPWSMLYGCVRDVIDVAFSVCIVNCGALCARVWEV